MMTKWHLTETKGSPNISIGGICMFVSNSVISKIQYCQIKSWFMTIFQNFWDQTFNLSMQSKILS